MKFEVTILGSGSSTPSLRRNPASQLVNIQENYFLVDCGEGTQLQMRKYKVKFQRINHVFISHLHGDHYLGLIGLLQSMHLLGRKNELHIYAHPDLKEMIDLHMKISHTRLTYTIQFHPLSYDQPQVIFDNKMLEVSTVILKHRIPTCGFVFREKQKLLPISSEALKTYSIPVYALPGIKEGKDFITGEGKVIPNKELTLARPASYSYAYCSDTIYHEKIIDSIQGVDVLFHESTFTSELNDRAKETFHSTAAQAATIALKAGVKRLVLGHFSVRYHDMDRFITEAREVFPATEIAEDGLTITIYP
ncbi:MAG: ribonuclease Z [Flavobacteriales bacterium]|nr:ribonuclease Z [Flavobacteriales bacterium]